MVERNGGPDCFGLLEIVFPLGPDDLRHVNSDCLGCKKVKACLKAASESQAGVEMRASRFEAMKRGSGQGLKGFLDRWSELKTMRSRAGSSPIKRGKN